MALFRSSSFRLICSLLLFTLSLNCCIEQDRSEEDTLFRIRLTFKSMEVNTNGESLVRIRNTSATMSPLCPDEEGACSRDANGEKFAMKNSVHETSQWIALDDNEQLFSEPQVLVKYTAPMISPGFWIIVQFKSKIKRTLRFTSDSLVMKSCRTLTEQTVSDESWMLCLDQQANDFALSECDVDKKMRQKYSQVAESNAVKVNSPSSVRRDSVKKSIPVIFRWSKPKPVIPKPSRTEVKVQQSVCE
jgi:hypothetical protein